MMILKKFGLMLGQIFSFLLEISPYLIIGFLFSGVLSVLLTVETVTKYLGTVLFSDAQQPLISENHMFFEMYRRFVILLVRIDQQTQQQKTHQTNTQKVRANIYLTSI